MIKNRLFTPGPTPVPENVLLKMAMPMIHHRHDEFIAIFKNVSVALKDVFQTKENVYLISGSGTGAMEAIVANFTEHNNVLIVNAGKFGERWKEINTRMGNTINEINLDWGQSVTLEKILLELKAKPLITHLFLTHSETSTGAYTDVKSITKKVKENYPHILVAVDGITSIGAHEFRFDDWQIDFAATGSQKGLMMPPGLAFLCVSANAKKQYNNKHSYYFDFKEADKSLQNFETPWTPPVGLVVALEEALKMMQAETMEKIWQRHQRLADATRAGVKALGLELFAEAPSNAVTSVKMTGLDGNKIVKDMKQLAGMTIANGQDSFKGKMIRLSHLGYYDDFDIISMIAGLEKVLKHNGHVFKIGSGVQASLEILFKE